MCAVVRDVWHKRRSTLSDYGVGGPHKHTRRLLLWPLLLLLLLLVGREEDGGLSVCLSVCLLVASVSGLAKEDEDKDE